MAEASTSSDPSTPPTTRNVRQSAKGPSVAATDDDETEDTGGGSDDSAVDSGSFSLYAQLAIPFSMSKKCF